MPAYVAFPDTATRKLLEGVVQQLSKESAVPCQSFEELLDFVQLHALGTEIELIVTVPSQQSGTAGSLLALEDLGILANTPIVILTDRTGFAEIPPSLPLVDVATIPPNPTEVRMRLLQLLRWREVMREKREYEHEFRELARGETDLTQLRDAETGLASHGTLLQFLDREWRRSLRYDRPIGAIVVGFEADHVMEPQFMKALGDGLRECLHRAGDIAGRYAPRQLCVVLSETDVPGTSHVAARILNSLKSLEGRGSDSGGAPGIRIGSASLKPRDIYQGMKPGLPREGPAEESLISAAFRSLEQGKQAG